MVKSPSKSPIKSENRETPECLVVSDDEEERRRPPKRMRISSSDDDDEDLETFLSNKFTQMKAEITQHIDLKFEEILKKINNSQEKSSEKLEKNTKLVEETADFNRKFARNFDKMIIEDFKPLMTWIRKIVNEYKEERKLKDHQGKEENGLADESRGRGCSEGLSPFCLFCKGEKRHESRICRTYRSITDRKNRMIEKGLCLKCCKSNCHFECEQKNIQCENCQGNHYSLFCDGMEEVKNCIFCKKRSHNSAYCFTYSNPTARKSRLQDHHHCLNCLEQFDSSSLIHNPCPHPQNKCEKCSETYKDPARAAHHQLLCGENEVKRSKKQRPSRRSSQSSRH